MLGLKIIINSIFIVFKINNEAAKFRPYAHISNIFDNYLGFFCFWVYKRYFDRYIQSSYNATLKILWLQLARTTIKRRIYKS